MPTEETKEPTVFVVDDDEGMRKSLAMLLGLWDLHVECFASADEFLAGYDGKRPGCLLLDVRLPGMSGVELHEKLVREGVSLPTIFITGQASPPLAEESVRGSVVAIFEKPYRPEQLIEAIQGALQGEPRL